MLSYCLKCRKKKTKSKNTKVVRTKNGRIMLSLKCTVYDSKKSKLLKEEEARRLLSNLIGIKVPILTDLPIINTLFLKYFVLKV